MLQPTGLQDHINSCFEAGHFCFILANIMPVGLWVYLHVFISVEFYFEFVDDGFFFLTHWNIPDTV